MFTRIRAGVFAPYQAAMERAAADLEVRLTRKISSTASGPGDLVDAVLIVPVLDGTGVTAPAGTRLSGEVVAAEDPAKPEEWAAHKIVFRRLGATPVSARVVEVNDARKTVAVALACSLRRRWPGAWNGAAGK